MIIDKPNYISNNNEEMKENVVFTNHNNIQMLQNENTKITGKEDSVANDQMLSDNTSEISDKDSNFDLSEEIKNYGYFYNFFFVCVLLVLVFFARIPQNTKQQCWLYVMLFLCLCHFVVQVKVVYNWLKYTAKRKKSKQLSRFCIKSIWCCEKTIGQC